MANAAVKTANALAAWRKLQESVALTPAKADAWIRGIRAERRASSIKREPKTHR